MVTIEGRLAYVDMTPSLHQRQKKKQKSNGPQIANQTSCPSPGDSLGPPKNTNSNTQNGPLDTMSNLCVKSQAEDCRGSCQHKDNPRHGNSTSRGQPSDSLPSQELSIPRSRMTKTPLYGLPTSNSDNSYLSLEEACLIRHFAEKLAPWVLPPITTTFGLS